MDHSIRLARAVATIGMAVSLSVTLAGCAGIAGVPILAAAPIQSSTAAEATTATTPVTETTPPPVTVTATATVTMPAVAPTTWVETTMSPQASAPPAPTSPPTSSADPDRDTDRHIRSEVDQAFDVVNGYWVDLFDTWVDKQGNPIQWRTPQLYNGDGFYDSTAGRIPTCGAGSAGASNASFCGSIESGTGRFAWDMELFRTYGGIGDGVYYVTVAHEFGHAAQIRFRHDGEGAAVPPDVGPAVELQADCLAGATLAKAADDGHVRIESGDLDEIASFLALLSDNVGSHGTADQRVESFRTGYDGDIESCLLQRQG